MDAHIKACKDKIILIAGNIGGIGLIPILIPKNNIRLSDAENEYISVEGQPLNYEVFMVDGKKVVNVAQLLKEAQDYLRKVNEGTNFEYHTLTQFPWGTIIALDDWYGHLNCLDKYIPLLEMEFGVKLLSQEINGQKEWFMVTGKQIKNEWLE